MNEFCEKEISGCSIAAIMNENGTKFSGDEIMRAIAVMRERSNGLGAGFAAYGIYPEFSHLYAFHLMFETNQARRLTEEYLKIHCLIEKNEPIPTRAQNFIKHPPGLWRYFLNVKEEKEQRDGTSTEEDGVVRMVMDINTNIDGAFVASSGKNMGIFKGVGYPEDIGRFYRLEEYRGYIWLAHGRFPTNSSGWWGGAHPFGLLDWAVVHNGEISSYGINKRYLGNFGYNCTLFTDTEVIAYLFDLLVRRHKFTLKMVSLALASPFWDSIERLPSNLREIARAVRLVYGSALLNGPFSIVVGYSRGILGLVDRIKLRPLVAARDNGFFYMSSEESGIAEVSSSLDGIWHAKAGVPILGKLKMPSQEPTIKERESDFVLHLT